jgi:hypothetical protein
VKAGNSIAGLSWPLLAEIQNEMLFYPDHEDIDVAL